MNTHPTYMSRPWLKFYPEKIPADMKLPDGSLIDAFEEAIEKWKKKTAIIFYGKKISYNALKAQVDRFATALYHLGVRKGDRIALYLLNSPQFIIAYFGGIKLGAVIVPVNPLYVSDEFRRQIEDCAPNTLICHDILYHVVEKAGVNFKITIIASIHDYLPGLKRIKAGISNRWFGKAKKNNSPGKTQDAKTYQFKRLLADYPPYPPDVDIDPKKDLAVLPYTTGTTARPKGIMLTHHNLLAAERLLKTFLNMKEGAEVDLAYMPFYFVGGQLIIMLRALLRGSEQIIFTKPDPDDALAAAEKYKATIFIGTPALYEILRDHKKTDRVDWGRFKYILAGADTLLMDTAQAWKRKTGTDLHECWGMTETSGIGMFTPKGKNRPGSFGVPLSNCLAAVVDPDTTEFLPAGQVGELIFHGPGVMQGYWQAPEETKNALIKIDEKVWLRTGDLVKMDQDGYFWFFDRKRDRIKYKGYRVSAREIEEVIASNPNVREVAVIGIPDQKTGERIKAFITPQRDVRVTLSEAEIMDWCRERLAAYKIPKLIEFRGEIPKSDVGKVSRRELREE